MPMSDPSQPNILKQLRAEATLGDQTLWVAYNSVGTVQAAFLTGDSVPGEKPLYPVRCWDCISGEIWRDEPEFISWVKTTLAGRFQPDSSTPVLPVLPVRPGMYSGRWRGLT